MRWWSWGSRLASTGASDRRIQSREVNVGGTDRMLELALELPHLRRFVMLSGYGVTFAPGDGPIPGGAYQVTKIESDRRAYKLARRKGLPMTRIHPGSVIGDSATGETTMYFGFGDLVRRIVKRQMPAIPGGARHWVPLVPVDYLATFLARVPLADTEPLIEYFVVDDRSPDLATLVRAIASHVGVPAPKRRVPLWVARAVARLSRDVALSESLDLLPTLRLDTAPADRAAAALGLVKPNLDVAIQRAVDFMVHQSFGEGARPDGLPDARHRKPATAGIV